MRLLHRLIFLAAVTVPTTFVIGAGCGGGGNVGFGGSSHTAGTGGNTGTAGTAGNGSTTSGTASTTTSVPFDGSPGCLQTGSGCTTDGDCCSAHCINGVCNLPPCTSDNQACTANGDCCSGTCEAGSCKPLNTLCKTLNNACASAAECCSGLCYLGVCRASSFCGQVGDICSGGPDCCSGNCQIQAGASLGTCAAPPTGSANCKLVDGMLCGGLDADGGVFTGDAGPPPCGGECCSRLCAPYGPTGAFVCQPASGCHVVGDLCTKDSDCCGSAGLPGGSGQPVTCDITPPNSVGVCRNPQGCKPDGDVCRLDTMSCNASCDCCSGNCHQGDTCKLDSVGVPRCAAAQCVAAGGACATSANCCNNLPCVPNPSGTPPFVCSQLTCQPACGPCTINADCCVGTSCVVPNGSTKGTCGPCGGVPDAGPPDSGVPDSGTPDSGTPDSGTPDSGPTCALFGQQCSANSDCCNGVPCSNPNGFCQAGQTGCTCHYVVQ